MWNGKTVSVVLMTYAERDSIRAVIDGFFDTGVVDEVLVVNNNAQAGTSEEVAKTEAREVFETAQGYGHATRRGLREAEGDLVLLAEPDGTFVPADILKMLSYSGECEAVLGTRTTRELIWSGRQHGLVPSLGQLGGREVRRGDLQHQPHQRHGLQPAGCSTAGWPPTSPTTCASARATPGPRS